MMGLIIEEKCKDHSLKGKEGLPHLQECFMRDNGRITNPMGMENKYLVMEIYIKEILSMD